MAYYYSNVIGIEGCHKRLRKSIHLISYYDFFILHSILFLGWNCLPHPMFTCRHIHVNGFYLLSPGEKRHVRIMNRTLFYTITNSTATHNRCHCLGINEQTKRLLLVKEEVCLYSTSYSTSNHRVVTDSEESHHLNMCRH